jgi:hypothetical protein
MKTGPVYPTPLQQSNCSFLLAPPLVEQEEMKSPDYSAQQPLRVMFPVEQVGSLGAGISQAANFIWTSQAAMSV